MFLMEDISPYNPTERMPGLTLGLFIWRQKRLCLWRLSILNLNGFLHFLPSLSTQHVLFFHFYFFNFFKGHTKLTVSELQFYLQVNALGGFLLKVYL